MTSKSQLSITLAAHGGRIKRGTPSPIQVEVRNRSVIPIWLVGVVDGSQTGARYPKWVAEVSNENGPVKAAETPDFTSPLRPTDFRRLAPGEAFDPTNATAGAAYFPIAAFDRLSEAAGTYTVKLTLDTDAPSPAAWMGTLPDHRPQAKAEAEMVNRMIRDVPRLKVTSNALVIEVH